MGKGKKRKKREKKRSEGKKSRRKRQEKMNERKGEQRIGKGLDSSHWISRILITGPWQLGLH